MTQDFLDFCDFVKSQFSAHNVDQFESIENWSSMQSLIVVSAIDEKYDVLIAYDELASLTGLHALYSFIQTKKKN